MWANYQLRQKYSFYNTNSERIVFFKQEHKYTRFAGLVHDWELLVDTLKLENNWDTWLGNHEKTTHHDYMKTKSPPPQIYFFSQ